MDLSYFAILLLGAVPVTVNTGFIKDPLVYNLKASNTSFAIVDTRLLAKYIEIQDKVDFIKQVMVIGKDKAAGTEGLAKPYSIIEDLLTANLDAIEKATPNGKDPCAMILTSGTTGPSKVVADCHAQFISSALFLVDAGAIAPDSVVYTYLGYSQHSCHQPQIKSIN